MRTIIYILLGGVLLSISSCIKDEPDLGYNIVWQKTITENAPVFFDDPIIHGDLLIQRKTNEGVLVALDKNTGDEVWRWTEAYDEYGVDGFDLKGHIHDDIYVTGYANLNYGINLLTGKTVWKNKAEYIRVQYINGYEDKFCLFESEHMEYYGILVGDVYTGEMNKVYEFEREDEYNIGSTLPLMIEWEGKEYLTFSKIKWGYVQGFYEENQWLHLYSLTDDSLVWVSDTIPLKYNVSGVAGRQPRFHDGQILLDNDAIYSYNIEDGSLQWWKHYGNNFTTSRLTAADGKVFGNNSTGYMVAVNVHTGHQFWHTETGGNAGHLTYHEGKVYISRAFHPPTTRHRLMVVDALDGSVLHDLNRDADNYQEDKIIGTFTQSMTVDPSTGYIYVGDHKRLMCIDLED